MALFNNNEHTLRLLEQVFGIGKGDLICNTVIEWSINTQSLRIML